MCSVKAGKRVVPQKALVFLLTVLHTCIFKMADKISMSQQALPEVMSQRYLKSAIYTSQCNIEKNDRNGLHFMTGSSLRLGPGKNDRIACITGLVEMTVDYKARDLVFDYCLISYREGLGTSL